MNDNQQTTGAEMRIPSQGGQASYWTAVMPRIGLALMIVGLIMSGCFAYDFADTNLGLMVGFGFIIGGTQVLLLGSLFHALQPKFVKSPVMGVNGQLDRVRT